MDIKVLSNDNGLPVDLDLVKTALRNTDNSEDTFITHLIKTVSDIIEQEFRLTLLPKTYCVTYETAGGVGSRGTLSDPDGIIDYVDLPRGPILEIQSCHEIDHQGIKTVFSGYRVDKKSQLIFWDRIPSKSYIQFIYKAGYQSDQAIPAIMKQAIITGVQEMFENRSGDIEALKATLHQILQGFKSYVALG